MGKEKREKMARIGGGSITFGDAISGGLEAHNFSSEISLQTTSEKPKRAKEDSKSTSGKTLTKSVFSVGGDTTTAGGMLRKSAENNDNDNEQDSWATSITSSENNDNQEEFHDAVGES